MLPPSQFKTVIYSPSSTLVDIRTFGVRIPATYGVAIPDRHPMPFTNAIMVGE